jgi:malonate decarboxylase beta subunit
MLVADDVSAFRQAALDAMQICRMAHVELALADLEAEQAMLDQRLKNFGDASDPLQIWQKLGISNPSAVPMLEAAAFVGAMSQYRSGVK